MLKFGVLLFAAYASTSSALPPCICTRNMAPVCGTDGVTYNNECLLNCARQTKSDLTLSHQGACDAPVCMCTYDYSPVCGTDGRTYGNECSLRCLAARIPELDVKHRGKCEEVKVASVGTPCLCTRQFKFVCGTDGNTYANPCMLNCASENNGGGIHVDYEGKCDGLKVKVVDTPTCTCTREMRPVCGDNGVTYTNMCLLQCAGRQLERRGPCVHRIDNLD